MTGEELIAPDVADEIVVQATLREPEMAGDDDVAPVTIAEWKAAIVAVLARYGARLTDESPDDNPL